MPGSAPSAKITPVLREEGWEIEGGREKSRQDEKEILKNRTSVSRYYQITGGRERATSTPNSPFSTLLQLFKSVKDGKKRWGGGRENG